MSTFSATPRCRIDIFPYEGGKYLSISGDSGTILSCNVHKNIRSSDPGTFQISLAPGGPNGPNAFPAWQEIITPMSFVAISMQRYSHTQTVMVGVVTNIQESIDWTDRGVRRTVTISGEDFQYFFTVASYYALSFLGTVGGAALGAYGFPSIQGAGLLGGTPDLVGTNWYNLIMAGAKGIMAQTQLPVGIAGNIQVTKTFPELMGSWFEPFQDSSVDVPLGDYFLLSEGNWYTKFAKIFPFPWYEFFITTAPPGTYTGAGTPLNAQFPIQIPGYGAVSPYVIARTNPLPWATVDNSVNSVISLNNKAWTQLKYYEIEGGYINSTIAFTESEVKNFFILNPTWLQMMFGSANGQIPPFLFSYSGWADRGSIHRFGYRPDIAEIHWLCDPTGDQGVRQTALNNGSSSFRNMVNNLALRQASYYEPIYQMGKGATSMELRPDIMPGCKFRYQPFKIGELWEFYITGISHQYIFGGESKTTLTLERGLPLTVYEDPVTLLYLHMGQVTRTDGQYKLPSSNPPATINGAALQSSYNLTNEINGLVPVNMMTASTSAFLAGFSENFVTPQAK